MFFESFVICLIINLTATSEVIVYISEEGDVEASAILRHLNISRMYYSNKFGVDDITLNHAVIKNTTSSDEHMENVREVFGWLPVFTNFVQIEQNPAKRLEQVNNISSSKYVIIFAETAIAEMLVEEDITPFRCEECSSINLFWIRPYATGKASDMRALREFLVDSEFNLEFNYSIKGSEEVEVSFYFHVMSFAFETLINTKNRSSKPLSSKFTKEAAYSFTDVLTVLNSPVPQYGAFERLGDSIFYENVRVKVYRVERTSDHPEETFNKEIASWTILGNITTLYESLNVDVKSIKEYRIATTLVSSSFDDLPPFVQVSEDPKKPYEGYCIDLIELIREELNFTYTIYEVEDGSFGSVDRNGNWNGLIGALMSGSADIALAPLTVNAERENVVDFTVPYYDLVGTTILMRKPDVEHSLFKFTKVLKWPVWLCTVAAYIVMSTTLWLFNRFSPYSYSNNRRK
ncbi:unnamed protein product [Cylicocyclus nassatus]|uniref:Uncharacterized protein n=1 Tax=Cylicocyclus nassatus TaxID=53992 RepID=A0AA36GN43_CYLNA|nr:unnamed protein product [Cylicocyclus nassatus]